MDWVGRGGVSGELRGGGIGGLWKTKTGRQA